ncbi:MAG TPA: ribosome maturation factor RimM, partial [Nostocaceae cyanobacterium]|nr:ribosome maturation factor RimM [Nostocaceae cyanobacterium]
MNREDTKDAKERKRGKEGKGNITQSPIPNLDDWLEIGKIVAPQGLGGEVRV